MAVNPSLSEAIAAFHFFLPLNGTLLCALFSSSLSLSPHTANAYTCVHAPQKGAGGLMHLSKLSQIKLHSDQM